MHDNITFTGPMRYLGDAMSKIEIVDCDYTPYARRAKWRDKIRMTVEITRHNKDTRSVSFYTKELTEYESGRIVERVHCIDIPRAMARRMAEFILAENIEP